MAHYSELCTRVIEQACHRVPDGEQVPTAEKIYSIFEAHTDPIKRGKVRAPVVPPRKCQGPDHPV
jgi:transposase, IS5 family